MRGAGATVANRTHNGSALRELPVVGYNYVKQRQELREERRFNLDGKSRKVSLRCISAETGKMRRRQGNRVGKTSYMSKSPGVEKA